MGAGRRLCYLNQLWCGGLARSGLACLCCGSTRKNTRKVIVIRGHGDGEGEGGRRK